MLVGGLSNVGALRWSERTEEMLEIVRAGDAPERRQSLLRPSRADWLASLERVQFP